MWSPPWRPEPPRARDVCLDHFSERDGLFVIIALGELLIVAAAGLTGAERTPQTVAAAILAVAVTRGLRAKLLRHRQAPARRRHPGARPGRPHPPGARRVQHPGLRCRLWGRAAGGGGRGGGWRIPHEALPARGRLALAGGVVLFEAYRRRCRRSGNVLSGLWLVILAAVAAGVWLTHGSPVTWSLLVVALGLVLLGAVE